MIVLGIVLGTGAGVLFGEAGDWQAVFKCSLPVEIAMFVGTLLVPESPRWLALRQRPEEAVEALQQAQGLSFDQAQKTVLTMTQSTMENAKKINTKTNRSSNNIKGNKGGKDIVAVEEERDDLSAKMSEIFGSKPNRLALTIGVGLVILQQLSGQPSVLYYANRIFQDAGLGFEAALGVGIFKFIMTIISASLVENPKFGRRKLLLYGNAGVTVSLAGLTTLYAVAGDAGPNTNAVSPANDTVTPALPYNSNLRRPNFGFSTNDAEIIVMMNLKIPTPRAASKPKPAS
jgi:MFS family permease